MIMKTRITQNIKYTSDNTITYCPIVQTSSLNGLNPASYKDDMTLVDRLAHKRETYIKGVQGVLTPPGKSQ